MIKIAIFNQKGGVGKSTITANLAGYLEKFDKKKVLVIDCDAQGNVSNYLTGFGVTQDKYVVNHTLTSLLDNPAPEQIVESIYPVYQPVKRKVYLTEIFVLPSDEELDDIDIPDIRAIKKITNDLDKSFDICLLDCPPQKTPTTLCALTAADYVLVPIQLDTDSVKGMKMVMDLVDFLKEKKFNPNISILGFVVNQYTKNGSLDNYLLEQLRESYGDYIFDSLLPFTSANKQAKFFATLLCYYKKCLGQREYLHFEKEVIKKIEERSKC